MSQDWPRKLAANGYGHIGTLRHEIKIGYFNVIELERLFSDALDQFNRRRDRNSPSTQPIGLWLSNTLSGIRAAKREGDTKVSGQDYYEVISKIGMTISSDPDSPEAHVAEGRMMYRCCLSTMVKY